MRKPAWGVAVEIAREAGIREVEQLVVIDDAADGIVATANKIGADYIVLGSQGRRNVRDLLLGSSAQRVLHRASQPVLLVK